MFVESGVEVGSLGVRLISNQAPWREIGAVGGRDEKDEHESDFANRSHAVGGRGLCTLLMFNPEIIPPPGRGLASEGERREAARIRRLSCIILMLMYSYVSANSYTHMHTRHTIRCACCMLQVVYLSY